MNERRKQYHQSKSAPFAKEAAQHAPPQIEPNSLQNAVCECDKVYFTIPHVVGWKLSKAAHTMSRGRCSASIARLSHFAITLWSSTWFIFYLNTVKLLYSCSPTCGYVYDGVGDGVPWPRQGEVKALNVPPAATAAAPVLTLMKIQRDAQPPGCD